MNKNDLSLHNFVKYYKVTKNLRFAFRQISIQETCIGNDNDVRHFSAILLTTLSCHITSNFHGHFGPLTTLKSNVIYGHSHKENFRDEESMNLIPVVHLVTPDGVSNI